VCLSREITKQSGVMALFMHIKGLDSAWPVGRNNLELFKTILIVVSICLPYKLPYRNYQTYI
jgi:hypothetical protein